MATQKEDNCYKIGNAMKAANKRIQKEKIKLAHIAENQISIEYV